MGIPSIGILYHFPSYTRHGYAIDCLATDHSNPNLREIEKMVLMVLVAALPSVGLVMLPVAVPFVGYLQLE